MPHGQKVGIHGWVYGYGLHITTTASGFPIIAITDTAKVSEKTVLDQTTPPLIQRNIGYLVADDGLYRSEPNRTIGKTGTVTHHTGTAFE